MFSINTVVGVACAIGMDFNTSHHDYEVAEVSVDIHEIGKKHQSHNGADKDHHDKKDTSKKDDCCNNKVIKFQSLDKNLNQNAKAVISVSAFVAIISTFMVSDVFKIAKASPPKYKNRFFYPPSPDIRIAIQSFQI